LDTGEALVSPLQGWYRATGIAAVAAVSLIISSMPI
jgi:hypothetical protein